MTRHVQDLVDDYVHELLTDTDAAYVEKHCGECADCGRALDAARRRLAAMQALPTIEPSAELIDATLERVADAPPWQNPLGRRFWGGVVGALAASMLLLAGTQLYVGQLQASPIDLVVLGQRELLAATTASMRVQLTNRSTSGVLAQVPVLMTLTAPDGKSQTLADFVTDDRGTGAPKIAVPDWPDGNYYLDVAAGGEKVRRQVTLKRSWKLMLSTDKPVYQPGQTILVRALGLRRPDLKPVAGKTATFTLTDPRGNVLFKHTQPLSAFGIASAECLLDHEILEGTYTVACNVEGNESRQSVEVKRYVLPKFRVRVTPNRPYFAPTEKATVTFQADYFFGKPVAGGRLDYDVKSATGQEVAAGSNHTLDAKGTHRLEFALPKQLAGRENDAGDARLTVTATVTDTAGQTYTSGGELLVTTRPVRIEAVPESGQLVEGVENIVYVLVRRADGTPLAKTTVVVKGDEINETVKTDDRGVTAFRVTPRFATTTWEIEARDAGGEVLARHKDIVQLGVVHGDFLVRLDRAVCKAGESLTLSALGGGGEPVFLDLVKDNQTMLSQMIPMANGSGELTLDVPPDLFGTVQLIAYRFGAHGLPVRKARVLYVTPPDGLRISTTLDHGEYRPGTDATLTLRLTDDKGKPTPGAISLVAVDEAVYAVLAQKPGMEQAFYTLEQEMLKPVYAVYPWFPEDDPANRQRDRALFARTARGLDTPAASTVGRFQPRIAEVGPHTLAVRTLPDKQQQIDQTQRVWQARVRQGWAGVVMAAVAFAYLALWTFVPLRIMLWMHAGGAVAVVLASVPLLLFTPLGAEFAGSKFDMVGGRMAAPEAKMDRFFATKEAAPGSKERRGAKDEPRVRRDFPETLLWKPELITDDQGRLPPLKVPLADSITTWRLTASAVAADGRLGAGQWPIKVFQPFFVDLNLPVTLTRGDEVGVPVVVYNYLDKPQAVTLTLTESPWFSLSGPATQTLELAGGEVRATRFTLKVSQVGTHPLLVTAKAGGVSDAIERQVEVVPDGKKVETAFNGSLASAVNHTLDVPPDAVEGSVKAFVKLYPSSFSQLLEGLENIFHLPNGCFEQTSSTTYPNVLALDYLRRNKIAQPAVEAKAKQYIHLGYQRLVGFEVQGGGFDWYGRPAASVALTAYGLLEFTDMAKVHDVDPRLLDRTRKWLIAQRKADGTWDALGRGVHLSGVRDMKQATLATTAYVAWALYADPEAGSQSGTTVRELVQGIMDVVPTVQYLQSHRPDDISDPHTLALVCNALVAINPNAAPPYLDRLAALAKRDDGGKFTSWEQEAGRKTTFHGAGLAGRVETTALATLALLQAKAHPELSRSALAWLVARKDPNGTWYSTQATVLALKALLAGTGQPADGDKERRIEVRVGRHVEQVTIPADQAEVMKLLDVSKHVKAGATRVELTEQTKTAAGYQVVFRYHVPEPKTKALPEPLAITIDYDRTELAVGGKVAATATVINQQKAVAPMVMLDLPIPPGFAASADEFAELVKRERIARFQVLPRSVLVYLRGLEPDAKLTLGYTLEATMPVQAAARGGRAYEYYDPAKEGSSRATRFVVKPRE